MSADIERLAVEFELAGRLAPNRVGPVVVDTAMKVRDTMRQSAPVRTTRLDRTPGPGVNRDSITARGPRGGQLSRTSTHAIVGPTYFVSRFLVDGTSRMPPQWNPGAAADPHEEGFVRGIADVVGKL